MSQMDWGHAIGNWGDMVHFIKWKNGWLMFYCFVESKTCKWSTWIFNRIDFHSNCERSGWHLILFLLPYISLSLEVTDLCNSWIFLGCYDTNLFACWLFPLSILKFLWTAKLVSTCPSAFQLLKLYYISYIMLFILFSLTLQIYDFKYFTVILVGFWLKTGFSMWNTFTMLNEINVCD